MDLSRIIIMLARQRSGTNSLRDVLNRHPDVHCLPEVFHNNLDPQGGRLQDVSYFTFLERHLDGGVAAALSLTSHETVFLEYLDYLSCLTDARYVLLDVKYNSTHHLDGAWRFITEEPRLFTFIKKHGLRVLNLTRRNYLRYYVSEVKAQRSQTWHAFDAAVVGDSEWFKEKFGSREEQERAQADAPVHLDPAETLHALRRCQLESEFVARALEDHSPYLQIEYADLYPVLGAPPSAAELARLAEWLDLDELTPERPRYRKQATLTLRDTIANYPEIEAMLTGTELAYCLEDEAMYRAAGEPTPAS